MIKKNKKAKPSNSKNKNSKKNTEVIRSKSPVSKIKKQKTNKDSTTVDVAFVELNESGKKVVINESNYICVTDYNCSMSAYQDPDDMVWRFALEIFTEDEKLIDIHSQQTYQTYQDALLDCYGIIEYLGFGVIDRKKCAQIVVNFWDETNEQFDEQLVYFDGLDFFKNKKVETIVGE
jgi:hypothetical protein